MIKKLVLVVAALAVMSVNADLVTVDIESITEGTYSTIDGIGASFAQAFEGQTVSGSDLIGVPTSLTLDMDAGEGLVVDYWGSSNSILPRINNQGPLVMLLDDEADMLSWRMGFADNPGEEIYFDFYTADGVFIEQKQVALINDYNDYYLTLSSAFQGVAIHHNTDAAGLRFQNFSYNTVPTGPVSSVPEPSVVVLMGISLLSMAGFYRRKK
ncbi:MAG: PEP-CTERM sorting domain-containing protein [Chitinispirillaceae bacterium]|nr:PEP-CTERM sorting domain-containing protein [Chitinispirillaceae bacterium]